MKLIFKIFSISLTFFLFTSAIFAQSSLFSQIDSAIQAKNPQAISDFLASNSKSSSYSRYETYILQKAREMLISNDLDLALALSLAVIDNNLDNFDAVALYTSIDSAIAKRNAQLKAEEERKQIEEIKLMANNAKEQKQIKREYQTISNTVSGETVYLDQDYNTHYLPVSWALNLGMADVALYIDPLEVSGKYGLSTNGNFYYHGEKIAIGGDYFADTMLLKFKDEENAELSSAVSASLCLSHSKISRNLFLRAGYTGYFSNREDLCFITVPFHSPTVGLGLRDIKIGDVLFETSFDYFLGHLMYEDILTAFDLSLNFSWILADLDKADIGLNFGIRDALYVMDDGSQNQLKLIISVGVCNND